MVRGYGGAGGGGGDSEGTISDSENSTTGEPDNDNLGPVEDESRAASPARDAGAGLEPAKDPEGDDAVGKTDVKSGTARSAFRGVAGSRLERAELGGSRCEEPIAGAEGSRSLLIGG